ncbi:protein TonB [Oryzisolibacter propanilivorax]|uniref:Protein TonB n=1 Tax=Oryzisolibacter propanilivorax TaxID=1527607 RepID=A0A1G9RNU1_9BURK|nr:TonB family protein [Oryzisolibacter propanilivorax]SDM24863.1 protein TonB [Oryzisolibacter propanilivorax]
MALPRPSTLQLALGVSVALHAALVAVRFVDPERFNRVFQDTPLEVILVNARSQEKPDQAQAIAQASLAGGGDAEAGRATSPLPSAALTRIGDELEESQRQMDQLQERQTQLLQQMRQQLAAPVPAPVLPSDAGEVLTQEHKRLHLQKLLAEIEKRINEENARPRKRYISPATREAVYAIYYDALRRRIEDKGTQNFPEQAGRKLYGELVMVITVNHDGRVLETEVAQGSGNALLDRRAEAIVRAAAPFGAFGPAMRARADQIAVVSRFRFTREQTLETDVR